MNGRKQNPYFLFSAPTILICGSTQSGKTYFTKQLLEKAYEMFTMPVDKITYANTEHQDMFHDMEQSMPTLVLHQGFPQRKI